LGLSPGLQHGLPWVQIRPCSFLFAKNTPFSLLSFIECSSFFATAFGFRFRLDLPSDLLIFVYQGVFLPLIFIGFDQKRRL
jgi:hypothetical protein